MAFACTSLECLERKIQRFVQSFDHVIEILLGCVHGDFDRVRASARIIEKYTSADAGDVVDFFLQR